MAIYCSHCGKELPDDASFCMKCGKPLKGGVVSPQTPLMRWEYKDLVIRLNDIKEKGNK
jgi:predicted amidophosphoribosyltransferase